MDPDEKVVGKFAEHRHRQQGVPAQMGAAELGGAAGTIGAALFRQLMFGDVSAGGNCPIAPSGGEWKSLVMETALARGFVTLRAHAQQPAGLAPRRWVVAVPEPADTAGAGACGDGGRTA